MKTFSPGVNPSYTFETTRTFPHHRYEFQKPYVARRPLSLRPLRMFNARYNGLTKKNVDYFVSFFQGILGPTGEFKWPSIDVVEAPESAGPDVSQSAGGALSPRTYYVRFTWYDSATSTETTASPTVAIALGAGNLATVTAPIFPSGVTSFRIYAGTSAGTEWLQAASTVRAWTEPTTGLIPTTSLAPGTNTLRPDVVVALSSGYTVRKTTANRYAVDLELEEQFAT